MSYALLLAPALVAAFALAVVSYGRTTSAWMALALAALPIVALTIVFDSMMIAADLFRFDPDLLLGVRLGLAPIEDLGYALVALLVVSSVWRLQDTAAGKGPTLVRRLMLASRPVSWINTAYPFAAAMVLTTGQVDARLVVGTLFFLVPYNVALYGINDAFDYDSDVQNPRKGGVEGALLPPPLRRAALIASASLALPFVVFLIAVGNPASWLTLGVSLFAVVAYSVPRLRFKEVPVLDSVTSATHFVSPAVYGLVLAGATWTPRLLAALAGFFLWCMASHAFGAVQDVLPDREADIGSIATALGARVTVRLAIILWVLAGVLMTTLTWPGPVVAAVAVPYVSLAAPFWNITDAASGQVNRGWRQFLWVNYVSGAFITLICITWVGR